MRPLAWTLLACLGFMVVGALAQPPGMEAWLQGLERPAFSAPPLLFLLVSAGYYLLFGVVLYRSQVHVPPGDPRRLAVGLTLTVMAVNEFWNALFVGLGSVLAGFLGAAAFAGLLAWLWLLMPGNDRTSFWALSPYVAWALYDLAWSFELWRLNA